MVDPNFEEPLNFNVEDTIDFYLTCASCASFIDEPTFTLRLHIENGEGDVVAVTLHPRDTMSEYGCAVREDFIEAKLYIKKTD